MMPVTYDAFAARFANAAVACFAAFAVGLAVMHVLRPDYAPSAHMISDYAVGPWGSVMTTAFASMGLGCLMLGLALVTSHTKSVAAWLAAVMFVIASAGSVVTATFPTDLPGAPSTTSGDIHAMSFYVNVACLVLAAATLAVIASHDSRWRAYRRGCAVYALLLALALVLQLKTLHRGMPFGLANRLFVVIMICWLLFITIRLRQITLPSRPLRGDDT
ncbi:DUF998 domain-containing protein [Dyella sp. C9]|uniref:DUF998 domain-containing protein n=1 Tax=Dyella sp. C9 TaxID=2202154 RepID=UPI000DEF030F|nr:DUF998 domain-containing protein [Dyella sp. C9]